MFDIHCHALPGVDDGAGGMEEAMKMLSAAAAEGTRGIVLTPHANLSTENPNYYDNSLIQKISAFRDEVRKRDIPLKIFQGQEIFCSGRVLTLLRQGLLITLNGSRYLLVEFDFDSYASSMISKISQLKAEGYIPIVAHPERYFAVIETTDVAKRMKAAGAFLQVNKGSIEGSLGDGAFSAGHRILERRLADFVASDSHSPYSRNACLGEVDEYISEEFSPDYAELLLSVNPKHVLKNETLY